MFFPISSHIPAILRQHDFSSCVSCAMGKRQAMAGERTARRARNVDASLEMTFNNNTLHLGRRLAQIVRMIISREVSSRCGRHIRSIPLGVQELQQTMQHGWLGGMLSLRNGDSAKESGVEISRGIFLDRGDLFSATAQRCTVKPAAISLGETVRVRCAKRRRRKRDGQRRAPATARLKDRTVQMFKAGRSARWMGLMPIAEARCPGRVFR